MCKLISSWYKNKVSELKCYAKHSFSKKFEIRTKKPTKIKAHSFEWAFIYSRIISYIVIVGIAGLNFINDYANDHDHDYDVYGQ